MGLSVEAKIDLAWRTVIAANAEITAASVPVYSHRDVSHARPGRAVVVLAGQAQAENLSGSSPEDMFRCEVELICTTNIADDANRAKLVADYQSVLKVVQDTTPAALTTAAGGNMTIYGFTQSAGDEGIDGSTQYISTKCVCHLQTT